MRMIDRRLEFLRWWPLRSALGTVAGFQLEHVGAQRLETQRIRRPRACRTTFMDITGRTDPASMSYTYLPGRPRLVAQLRIQVRRGHIPRLVHQPGQEPGQDLAGG